MTPLKYRDLGYEVFPCAGKRPARCSTWPYDHGTDGAPTWQCERCGWACKVNDTPRDVARWQQAMAMQHCVDEQMICDWVLWPHE